MARSVFRLLKDTPSGVSRSYLSAGFKNSPKEDENLKGIHRQALRNRRVYTLREKDD